MGWSVELSLGSRRRGSWTSANASRNARAAIGSRPRFTVRVVSPEGYSDRVRLVALVAGIGLTGWVLVGLLTVMLVPRNPRSVVSRSVIAGVWAITKMPIPLMRSYRVQDRWLACAAPITILLQLAVFAVGLILTLGLVVYGTTNLSIVDSMYQSGATFTTLGIVEPVNSASAITTFVAAFLGLVVIAVFIGYLMALYGSYSDREEQMALLSQVAGEPAWAPEVIRRSHLLNMESDAAISRSDWLRWISGIRLSHRVSPVLNHVRSPSSTRHWVISMLAVLDAVALRAAMEEGPPESGDIQLLSEGAVTLALLAGDDRFRTCNWEAQRQIHAQLSGQVEGASLESAGLTGDQWEQMSELLLDNGVVDADTLAKAQGAFCGIRSMYVQHAYALARDFHAVRAPWSGDRSPTTTIEWPDTSRIGLADQSEHTAARDGE